ncbi:scavenger receptor cysteine-rich domain-containing protein DMBT1-like [Cetorhinus maximus]
MTLLIDLESETLILTCGFVVLYIWESVHRLRYFTSEETGSRCNDGTQNGTEPGFRKVFEGEPGICVQHSVKAQFPAQDPSTGKMLRSFLTLTALQLLKCQNDLNPKENRNNTAAEFIESPATLPHTQLIKIHTVIRQFQQSWYDVESRHCRTGNSQADPSEAVKLRLANGGSRCAGRLEIHYRGQWGTVYDESWDLQDAAVVCRELGCGTADPAPGGAHFGEGSGPIATDNVECSGSEAACETITGFPESFPGIPNARADWKYSSAKPGEQCVIFTGIGMTPVCPCAGRVEIYYNGTWGSVCDDSWDLTDADVFCKQLHCGKALDVTLPASCGPGSGPVWLEGLECSGEESYLWQCPSAYWGSHDCSHKEDVKIMCSEHKELRLVNGKHRCQGRAEVFYNGTWGTVCWDALDSHDAEVICKQLQCGPLDYVDYSTRSFGEGSGCIWLDEIECISHESTIWQCRTEPWGQHNCDHRRDAGVLCSGGKITKDQPESEKDCARQSDSGVDLHLIGGNTICSGRVEIKCKNTSGTVCYDSWDMADANVVCRQLGCGSALFAAGGAAFGQGGGAMWFDEVRCTGSESFLSDCPSSASAQPDCDHKEDASVICSGPELSSAASPFTPAGWSHE